ncbi:MAG: hypothetical protein OXC26_14915 [Albidovulum sp.]|nr:hypothetical protein [Albidovulum sp.]
MAYTYRALAILENRDAPEVKLEELHETSEIPGSAPMHWINAMNPDNIPDRVAEIEFEAVEVVPRDRSHVAEREESVDLRLELDQDRAGRAEVDFGNSRRDVDQADSVPQAVGDNAVVGGDALGRSHA